jgi:hypothetical protein
LYNFLAIPLALSGFPSTALLAITPRMFPKKSLMAAEARYGGR